MTTYTGSQLATTITRDGSTSTARTGQTWSIYLPRSINFVDFVTDIRIAGNYTLSIDSVVVATVNGVTAAQAGVTFTPAAPIELAAGKHTLVLTAGGASIQWYYKLAAALQPTSGTGSDYIGWGTWVEAGGGTIVPGTIHFVPPDGSLVSKMPSTTASSGTFTAQTFTVTFDVDVTLYALRKNIADIDAVGYGVKVDGVTVVPQTPVAGTNLPVGLPLTTPLHLSAGAHTIAVFTTTVRHVYYNVGTSGAVTGDAHTTGWSVWAEATGNKVEAILFYELFRIDTPISRASATETARALTVATSVPINRASATETARALTTNRAVPISRASATEVARPIAVGVDGSVPISRASSTEIARALALAWSVPISRASSTETARTLGVSKAVLISRASATETARALSLTRAIAVSRASSTEVARALTAIRGLSISRASSTEVARALTVSISSPGGTLKFADGTTLINPRFADGTTLIVRGWLDPDGVTIHPFV